MSLNQRAMEKPKKESWYAQAEERALADFRKLKKEAWEDAKRRFCDTAGDSIYDVKLIEELKNYKSIKSR